MFCRRSSSSTRHACSVCRQCADASGAPDAAVDTHLELPVKGGHGVDALQELVVVRQHMRRQHLAHHLRHLRNTFRSIECRPSSRVRHRLLWCFKLAANEPQFVRAACYDDAVSCNGWLLQYVWHGADALAEARQEAAHFQHGSAGLDDLLQAVRVEAATQLAELVAHWVKGRFIVRRRQRPQYRLPRRSVQRRRAVGCARVNVEDCLKGLTSDTFADLGATYPAGGKTGSTAAPQRPAGQRCGKHTEHEHVMAVVFVHQEPPDGLKACCQGRYGLPAQLRP